MWIQGEIDNTRINPLQHFHVLYIPAKLHEIETLKSKQEYRF